jgi:hypothetical protein
MRRMSLAELPGGAVSVGNEYDSFYGMKSGV